MHFGSLDQIASRFEVDLEWLASGLNKGDLYDVRKETERFAGDLHSYKN